jgi:hypothetical protein
MHTNAILIVLFCLCIASCESTSSGKLSADPFYTDKGDFDMARIPPIKPYEATVPATGSNDWIVASVDTNDLPLTIPGTKEVTVIDTLILLHSLNTTLDYQPVKEAWFVLIPNRRLVKGFNTHGKYLGFIKKLGLRVEPKLYNIGKVFNYFDSNDTLDWKKVH